MGEIRRLGDLLVQGNIEERDEAATALSMIGGREAFALVEAASTQVNKTQTGDSTMKKTIENAKYDPRYDDFVCIIHEQPLVYGCPECFAPDAKPIPREEIDAIKAVAMAIRHTPELRHLKDERVHLIGLHRRLVKLRDKEPRDCYQLGEPKDDMTMDDVLDRLGEIRQLAAESRQGIRESELEARDEDYFLWRDVLLTIAKDDSESGYLARAALQTVHIQL